VVVLIGLSGSDAWGEALNPARKGCFERNLEELELEAEKGMELWQSCLPSHETKACDERLRGSFWAFVRHFIIDNSLRLYSRVNYSLISILL
jgi:hypothetical protein